MIDVIRAAWVIARRDYVASVFSRAFLLFLIGPLLPILAGLLFSIAGAGGGADQKRPAVAVIAGPAEAELLHAARGRLAERLGDAMLPMLHIAAPEGGAEAQTRRLLADRSDGVVAVARGGIDAPRLIGPRAGVADVRGRLALIYDEARAARAMADAGAAAPGPVAFRETVVERAAGPDAAGHAATARAGQLVLMFLTMILAGMLLSNLIEEKSNKVIEVLAAAVPVDAIFLGKLAAMLAMSLTGIAVWGAMALLALRGLFPAVTLPVPAVGWGAFVALGTVYFVACYLLLGALFLGIGAQVSSVREVQTLSMPVTMGQLGVVALASSVVAAPESGLAKAATVFPWSSPFAMIARAAQAPEIWPHLLAIGWQALWIGLIIRFAARRFRVSVLKSGGPRRRWFRRWRTS
ncbi:ABC transporter permease [Edaphosphingomonas haloaromaticamans]|uniref:ABC-2 family transporter protein n=1 Tax=Edaphosphingomonas haloaromaticamans TaxID=653954 RepID=A0A1S1H864_9SPHN|nr:ABC transporter permease [Sphingomonas haloaromaticamans]OHT18379.1 ABC-2 family transporter protein [Sphingomonas haloaromaticamans]